MAPDGPPLLQWLNSPRCLHRAPQVLEEMDHPFILKLYTTYALHNRVYFLLDIALAGDLYRCLPAALPAYPNTT